MGPLFIKTENSLLKSLIKNKDLIDYAIKHDIKTLGTIDDDLFGALEFYNLCKKNNIKPIIGLDIYDIYLFAKNYEGYKNLLKLNTLKRETNITIDILKQYKDNLVCVVPEYLKQESYKFDFYENKYNGYINNYEENSIYCNQILYLEKEDYIYYNYLDSIKTGNELTSTITHNYLLQYKDKKTNNEIINLCNLEIKLNNNLLPLYPCDDSYEYLKKLVLEGLKSIFGTEVSLQYKERLKYELDIINKMGFCNYFLIVWDYTKYAKDNNILYICRGSASGSLVSYCLGITNVDPIKYNLFFERFLNPERISMPDIDIDFEFTKKDQIIKYCIEKYGIKKVAPIITFGTLGTKQVIRDVAKCQKINIENLIKQIDSKQTLKQNYNNLKNYINTNNLENLFQVAFKLEGLKRHTSIHAAGVVMCKHNLDEVIPLIKNDDHYLTGYSMEYLESLGLLKMDLLALKNLTLLNNCLKETNINLNKIPLNDEKTLNLFKIGDTLGIFQFESEGIINTLKKIKTTSFDDIIATIALYRPGPMQFIDTYVKRKEKKEQVDCISKEIEPIIKNTYGIIVYQEQIMQIANKMANYTLGEADILRKAMSKKKEDILLKEKDKFIKGCLQNNYKEEIAIKVYEMILKFAQYGFNKAHSVSYSLIAYYMAYLKVHYPNIFLKNLLSLTIGSDLKTTEYINKFNVKVSKPDINYSQNDYTFKDEQIIFPFTNIKGVGKTIGKTILESREKNFTDIFDFFIKCGKKLNKNTIINLIKADCFRNFNINQKTLEHNLELLKNYSELGELVDDLLKPVLEYKEEYKKQELLQREYEVIGTYLSEHPVLQYKNKYKCININDINNHFNKTGYFIIIADKFKKIVNKNYQDMGFLTGSDETGTIDFILFSNVYTDIEINKLYIIEGKVEKRFDKYQVIVVKIKKVP